MWVWVDGVGVDPAPGAMVARGVGNLYTWCSRRGVRESMICRYERNGAKKEVFWCRDWGTERRLIFLFATTTGFALINRQYHILCTCRRKNDELLLEVHRHIENILF